MEEITTIGETTFRGENHKFGIKEDDRRRHVYMIGKTGVGKTTLIDNMVRQDIENGKGVALVDPHGDLAKSLLDAVPPSRVNDVVYLDPADVDYPVAFNVMQAIDPKYKYLVSSGLIGVLQKIWADTWGPRLEYILRNTILAVLDYPDSTMLGVLRMLSDDGYRKKVVAKVTDPVVKAFWYDEFAHYNERFKTEAVAPIQNKVGQFLTSSIIRNIISQPKSTIDMKEIMDTGKILLVNVSKGRIGEDNSALLGAMIITHIQLAAMDRANIEEEKRRDFYLYVDEFQNFATESFGTILSEARKYRLNLTIGHQYITQMEEPVRDAVFGNTGTLVSFRVGATDSEFLEKEFAPTFTETDLVNLDKYNAYIRLMINGIASKGFSMRTIPPTGSTYGLHEKIIKASRERYAQKREIVEDKIARWSQADVGENNDERSNDNRGGGGGNDRRDNRHNNRNDNKNDKWANLPSPTKVEKSFEEAKTVDETEEITDLEKLLKPAAESIKCAECGAQTSVPFKPTPGRPAYCRDCLVKVREEKKKEGMKMGVARDSGLKVKEGKEIEDKIKPSSLAPPPLR
jgi:CxxC-x17-CxxC domain-containing protein